MDRSATTPFIPGDIVRERYFGVVTEGTVMKYDDKGRPIVATTRNGAPFNATVDPERTQMVMPVGKWPLLYRDYEIYRSLEGLAPPYSYTHKDFDGDEDNRYGHEERFVDCITSVDEAHDA